MGWSPRLYNTIVCCCCTLHISIHIHTLFVAIVDGTHVYYAIHYKNNKNIPCIVAIVVCTHVGSAEASLQGLGSITQENTINQTVNIFYIVDQL